MSDASEFAQMEPVLYRFALRATGDAELARDLVQDTLVNALADAERFAGRSSLRTWTIGILSHKIADHFRRRATRSDRELTDSDDADLLRTPSEEDVERVVAARQELATVERALGKLSERDRLAVLMVDVEDVDREEVCRVLGLSATHLRVLLHRARNELRQSLERESK